jgi:hypothetical protein
MYVQCVRKVAVHLDYSTNIWLSVTKLPLKCIVVSLDSVVDGWQRLVLRSIPKQAFADSFQKLFERCQPRVVKDGDYFEGQ